MNYCINLYNGNPLCWQTPKSLEDEEVKTVLNYITSLEPTVNKVKAMDYAFSADNDREWIALFAEKYGNLIIG